jgi:hypothetical protein
MRVLALYLIVTTFVCAPIWSVTHFVTQDGSAHVYNAYLMGELLNGNPFVERHAVLNSLAVPNSSGHWLLVLLLQLLPPDAVSKAISTLTYAAFVAAIAWLRLRTVGKDGVATSILLGAALGLNWMWLLGLYNFIISVICFIVAVGFYWTRREAMSAPAAAVLSLLLIATYTSHIVSFGIVAATVGVFAIAVPRKERHRTLVWTALALVPVVLLGLRFVLAAQGAEDYTPNWRSLGDAHSLAGWFNQLRSADPFIFISRKTFPFSAIQSMGMAVFAPIVWIGVSLACLAIATVRHREWMTAGGRPLFACLLAVWALVALVAPDDFGLTNGSVLRERVLLCALCLVVPLFRMDGSPALKRVVQLSLAFVIVFQSAALWEYAGQADVKAAELLSGRDALEEHDSLASVVIIDEKTRFHAVPEPQLNTLNGMGRNILIWDNYEWGHYLFPLVTKSPADREFVHALASSHAFNLSDSTEPFEARLARLEACLRGGHERIAKMLVWGVNAQVDAMLSTWFETEPYFVNGHVRLFRHRRY